MSANQRQIGGSHYGGGDYQHWDWVCDVRLHYLPATATKYIDRWRNHPKGVENLEKAIHYAEKAQEKGISGSSVATRSQFFWDYVITRKIPATEAAIIYYLMEGEWAPAQAMLQDLVALELK